MALQIRPLTDGDGEWVYSLFCEHWGAPLVVSRGQVHRPEELRGFVAERNGTRRGLVTYRVQGDEAEVVTLNALTPGQGVGSALLAAAVKAAQQAGCARLWLITTNDNLAALRFYQRRGMRLAALYPNALEVTRQLKPGVPRVGVQGIPLRDELELELPLGDGDAP